MPVIEIHPQGVCSQLMVIEYDDNKVITNARVERGCQGNLQGICSLIVGMPIDKVVERLEGIRCRGSRNGDSSCPDQMAKGLKELLK